MKISFLFWFFIFSFIAFSQTEEVLEISHIPSYQYTYNIESYKIINNKLFCIEYKTGQYYYRIIDLSQKTEIVYHELIFESKYIFNDLGLFFVKKKEIGGYYEYHYIDFNGNETVSSSIITYPVPAVLPNPYLYTETEAKFYYFTYENIRYCVYKTTGNSNSELKIFESIEKIIFIENLNGNVLIVTYDQLNYELYKYNDDNGNTVMFQSIPSTLPYTISVSGKDENNLYLSFVNDSNKFIYKTDLTNSGSQVFVNNKIGKLNFINNNRFVLKEDSITTSNPFLIANKNTANTFKNLTIQSADSIQGTLLSQRLGGEHFILAQFEKGFETGFINNEDSIEFISDLVDGYGSSFCLQNYSSSSYLYYGLNTPYLSLNDSTVLTIQTNGNDNNYYLYKTVNNQQTSLFKIDNPLRIIKFLFDKTTNTLYWIVKNKDYFDYKGVLYKRKLDDVDVNQPTTKPVNKETWFRQIATTYNKRLFDLGDNLRVKSKDVKIDEQENVYSYFTYYYSSLYNEILSGSVFSHDTNSLVDLKSRHIFSKFDKYGNLKWLTSIGEQTSVSWFDYEFEIDSENNPIILGYYFETGYFDDDSLTSPRACYFITKLDGETGDVIWKKKIAETYYTDDIFIDALTLDEDDNIYLAFMYPNFGIQIQDKSLEADLSMANAVAKFSPTGDVEWLKNIITPWTDQYGRSYIFNNNADKTLTICQTKGSAREQFIQTLDLDGNIIDTNSVSTTGFSRLLVGMNNSNSQLFGLGFFNNELEFERYKLSTSEPKNFSFMYDYNKSEPISFKQGLSTLFYPVDIEYYDNEFYVYGSIRVEYGRLELILIKFDANGNFIAYKSIGQLLYDSDLRPHNSFVVNKDFIVVIGQDFNLDLDNGVLPLITSNRSLSVLKIKNEDWIEDEDWFEQINTYLKPDESDVLIYPNPFINEFEIIFSSYAVDYNSYRIYNSSGEIVLEGVLSNVQFQIVKFQEYAAGTYIIQFIGDEKLLSKVLIKSE